MNAALYAATSIRKPVAEPQEATRVAVMRLTLTDFRCYQTARIETDGESCVLTGPNGAGKTNILEAVSFLAPGRGLRRAKTADVGRRDMNPINGTSGRSWAVSANLRGADGAVDIGTGTRLGGSEIVGSERRRVRIDGEETGQQSVLADHLAISWLTPQMDRLFMEGPTARRQFLDRLVYAFDPTHAGRISAYEHASRERMRLLDAGQPEPAWLDALESTIAERGVAVAAARNDMAVQLDQILKATAGPFPKATVTCIGPVEEWLAEGPALTAEDNVRTALNANRGIDARSGRAAFAFHRSDLSVIFAEKNQPAETCSTGEQKALLISLVLAHADLVRRSRGVTPILLLDEVAAHLDEERRSALFDRLITLGGQFWLTGTDASQFEPITTQISHFAVSDGEVRPTLGMA